MPKRLFKPPKHLIKEWPEVFEDMYMNTMPVSYLNAIKLEFDNGRVWKIEVAELLAVSDADEVTEKLLETIHEYHDTITKIDFEVDVERLKQDITDETKKFL